MTDIPLEIIKKAFWDTFNESGEIWFDYLSSKEDNNSSTNSEWINFEENLRKYGQEDNS